MLINIWINLFFFFLGGGAFSFKKTFSCPRVFLWSNFTLIIHCDLNGDTWTIWLLVNIFPIDSVGYVISAEEESNFGGQKSYYILMKDQDFFPKYINMMHEQVVMDCGISLFVSHTRTHTQKSSW